MIHGLLPDDREEEDTVEQKVWRNEMRLESEGENVGVFTEEELLKSVKEMKDKKAPGYDGIKSEVVKRMFGRIRGTLLDLYNKMLREGEFPDVWKKGIVKVFIKSEDKDPSRIKSYRPVTLLPVLGKIGERMVVQRLRKWMSEEGRINPRQYGFTEGVGTIDALLDMKKEVEEAEEKYVVGLFLDISGAFDSAWWPHVLRVLREWRCPNNLYKLIRDYFNNRSVTLRVGNGEVSKMVTRGCPQGSVLGPILWNIIFDGFLRLPYEYGISPRAYADDGLLLVKANTRTDMEGKCTRVLELVCKWGEERKLTFSKEKTVMVLLKGKMVERLLKVRMGEVRIRSSEETKYLGITIQKGMKFDSHCEKMAEKVKIAFGKLVGIARANNGLRCTTLRILYRGALEPMIIYGCEMWGTAISRRAVRGKIRALQRKILLSVIKGYNTISHEAVRVIAGVIPVDLLVQERMRRREDKVAGIDFNESKATRREETIEEWQRRWETSNKGRETFIYIPDVRRRIEDTWEPDHYVTQFLSGHGNFRAKLKGFNLVADERCEECGVPETAEHVLMECGRFVEERRALKEAVKQKGWRWEKSNMLRDDEVTEEFTRTARSIGRRKEEIERESRQQ